MTDKKYTKEEILAKYNSKTTDELLAMISSYDWRIRTLDGGEQIFIDGPEGSKKKEVLENAFKMEVNLPIKSNKFKWTYISGGNKMDQLIRSSFQKLINAGLITVEELFA